MSTRKKNTKKTVNATTVRRGHQLPARVNSSMWETLRAIALDETRSVSQVVVVLLREALQAREAKKKPAELENDK